MTQSQRYDDDDDDEKSVADRHFVLRMKKNNRAFNLIFFLQDSKSLNNADLNIEQYEFELLLLD